MCKPCHNQRTSVQNLVKYVNSKILVKYSMYIVTDHFFYFVSFFFTFRLFLIGLFDQDGNGTIDIKEFQQLWQYINTWKGVFDRYDRDRSGNIDGGELYTGELLLDYMYI